MASDMMQVLLIRHGESLNNVIANGLRPRIMQPFANFNIKEFESIWLQKRVDDPPLTSTGEAQAELVAESVADRINRTHHECRAQVRL